jgi:trehalose 6-phosphate phosphatase
MSRYLFDHLDDLGPRLRAAQSLALFLDLDGTLVPFQDDPSRTALPPSMQRLLRGISADENRIVAFVSGRERNDLQARVGVPGLIYAGNHGLEISGPGFIFIEPTAVGYRESLQKLAEALAPRLNNIDGAWVEDKGLTVSVHWRLTPAEKAEEVRRIVHGALENTSHPFVLTTGDKVYDIRPRVYWHKGSAVHWIRERLGKQDALTVFLGDDATDEDAFAGLPDGITIKVGEASETAAVYYVHGPEEAKRFLEWLANNLRQTITPEHSPISREESSL